MYIADLANQLTSNSILCVGELLKPVESLKIIELATVKGEKDA